MIFRKTRKYISVVLACLMLMLSFSVPTAADNSGPILAIDDVALVKLGETTTVDLKLSNLPQGIYMLQLAVEYDPQVLQLIGTTAGAVFSEAGEPTINDSIAGVIYLNWDSTDPQITEDCTLLTMAFSVIAEEPCDSIVKISETEECILANWETEFIPELTAGTVHIEKDWAVPRISSANFAGKIGLNYYLALPDYVINDPDAYVLFSGGKTDHIQKVSQAYPTTVNNELLYVFTYYMIAYEVRDTINLKLYDGNDNPVPLKNKKGTKDYTFTGIDYSLLSYCEYMIEQGSDNEMRALAQAALDYCTAAQIYFNYHVTDDLSVSDAVVNVQAAQLDPYKAVLEGMLPANVTVNSISAQFDSDNSLRIYMSYNNVDPQQFAYTVNGNPYTLRNNAGSYYICVENIASSELDTVHLIGVQYGVDSAIMKYSVLTYARLLLRNGQNDNSKNLAKALYLYNVAADAYFALHSN